MELTNAAAMALFSDGNEIILAVYIRTRGHEALCATTLARPAACTQETWPEDSLDSSEAETNKRKLNFGV